MVFVLGVCWSPDSRLLLFSLSSGEVHVYDNQGGFVSKVSKDLDLGLGLGLV